MYNNKPDTKPKRTMITRQIDAGSVDAQLHEKIENLSGVEKASESELVLHFSHQSEPVHINVEGIMTIGRTDLPNDISPSIDLTPYMAAELGVSRYHAEIIFNRGGFYIKDMGSTNGTWINGKRIPPYRYMPFKIKDKIRLGQLPMIVG